MKLYEKQKEEAASEEGTSASDAIEQKSRLEKFLKSEGKLVGSLPQGAENTLQQKPTSSLSSNLKDDEAKTSSSAASGDSHANARVSICRLYIIY